MDYPTSDLGFAAVLKVLQYPLERLETDNPNKIVFHFKIPSEHMEKIGVLNERYKSKDAMGDYLSYYQALKELKLLIKTINNASRHTQLQG